MADEADAPEPAHYSGTAGPGANPAARTAEAPTQHKQQKPIQKKSDPKKAA
jgi:hypothetical protein